MTLSAFILRQMERTILFELDNDGYDVDTDEGTLCITDVDRYHVIFDYNGTEYTLPLEGDGSSIADDVIHTILSYFRRQWR